MTYGIQFDLFLKFYTEKTTEEKIEMLKQYSTGDLLTLLRNIEESPREFDESIIKAVYKCLYDKKIICI